MEHETDLIRQILLGRNELFEQIVLEYQDLVYTVCLNIVRNAHDAENTAQDTFLTAYCSLADYRGGNFKSWLCRIAANKAIDLRRKQSRFIFEDITLLEEAAQDKESVEMAYERKEREEKIGHILSKLPNKYASVIKAFYYNQLTVKEIAWQLELPERTVETQLYRAKKMIRERWDEDEA